MKYKHLLFDADDTLLDFQASEQTALKTLFERIDLTFTQTLVNKYHEINHGLWAAFERGELTKDEILQTRFRKLFTEIGFEVDRPSLEEEYQELLASGHMLIPGATELLDHLKDRYDLYIVSNGVASTQYNPYMLQAYSHILRTSLFPKKQVTKNPRLNSSNMCLNAYHNLMHREH